MCFLSAYLAVPLSNPEISDIALIKRFMFTFRREIAEPSKGGSLQTLCKEFAHHTVEHTNGDVHQLHDVFILELVIVGGHAIEPWKGDATKFGSRRTRDSLCQGRLADPACKDPLAAMLILASSVESRLCFLENWIQVLVEYAFMDRSLLRCSLGWIEAALEPRGCELRLASLEDSKAWLAASRGACSC
ncbi:hypothetical protein TIFTF001_028398 [Ficus carica]|uniref:Uncharacterized protein n=1 Tax=Ficus carica TaxID=3494 RepID=A0AA88J1P1_FICCA|nr:hypothetical protein TIFTF001_028398 [Ficus carica]